MESEGRWMDNSQEKKTGPMGLDYEQLLITNELSEIIRGHNQCLERLRTYRTSYPYLMAPNIAKMMEENLKENIQMLYREFNNLHKPKTEQKRHVCQQCHSVFAVSLRGGICDECRSRIGHTTPAPGEAPRYPRLPSRVQERPADQEAEEQTAAADTNGAEAEIGEPAAVETDAERTAPAQEEVPAPVEKASSASIISLVDDEPPGDER